MGLIGLVRNAPGALGYAELAFATQSHVPYGAVKNRAGRYVPASLNATTAAIRADTERLQNDIRSSIVDAPGSDVYPIVGLTYLLIPKQPKEAAKGHALKDFLRWAIGPGQEMAPDLLYAPLPASAVHRIEQLLDTVE